MTTPAERYGAVMMNTYGPPKASLVRGEGCYVWDAEGTRYLDLFGGIAVNALGHAHPALVEAVTTQLRTLGHVSNFFATEPQVRLAERLLGLLGVGAADGPGTGKVFFASSGTEANEAALKLTRRTGRTRVVAAESGFHGRTMGALSLTGKAALRDPFEPLPGGVTFVPYGDAEALRRVVDDDTAALVLEPVQGEGGVVLPPEGYLAAAREATRDAGALLWLDEVQGGMGRTGEWFAHQPSGVRPDVVTLAKGLGGGIPIGACVALGEAGGLLQPGHHGTTFGGNPVAAAAALAVIDTIESEDLLGHVRAVGDRLAAGLRHERVAEVRARGLWIGIDLVEEVAASVVAVAARRGFLLNATGPGTVRLAPPLVVTVEQVEEFLAAWPTIVEEAG